MVVTVPQDNDFKHAQWYLQHMALQGVVDILILCRSTAVANQKPRNELSLYFGHLQHCDSSGNMLHIVIMTLVLDLKI